MAFENLTDREKKILHNLITHYITSADPVGSRVIANRFKMGISPATVRNTLQDLEELGLVEQPHTSAGRIPTDLGYRAYVDYLLEPAELTEIEQDYIKKSIQREGRGLRDILGQTSRILSDITKQLGVTIAPRFDEGVLRRLELIPINDERIMVVVVVESGLARTVIIEVDTAISEKTLQEVESVLNERLSGITLGEIRSSIGERLADVSGDARLVKLIIDTRDKIWTDQSRDGIQIAGTDQLLQHPEFAEVNKISGLLKMLESGKVLDNLLDSSHEAGLVITIGRENPVFEKMNCSVVASSYRVGKIRGTIGIIGPTRMPYNKLASVVDYTARAITEVLSGMKINED